MGRSGRSSPLRKAAALVAAGCAATFGSSVFVGSLSRSSRNAPSTQMKGWRLDKMALGQFDDGVEGLQTSEGFFIGEKAIERSQNAQGYRYRMRPTAEEYAKGEEVDGLMWQIGPFKVKFGEVLGGTGNNAKLRELKKKLATEGLTDPVKLAENEYWKKRYGHKRWGSKNVDMSTGLPTGLFRGLGAWSGLDPLGEEIGKTYMPVPYRNPMLKPETINSKLPPGQVELEDAAGKLD